MSTKETSPKTGPERIYEVGYHIVSSIAEEQIPSVVERVKTYLAKERASVIAEEEPKLRPLAYPIKKAFGGAYKSFDKAYFGFIKFELPDEGDVAAIDAAFKADPDVLRYLLIKTVRENTMYSPKISVFTDKEGKPRAPQAAAKGEEKSASVEEIDKSIDKFVKEEVEAK